MDLQDGSQADLLKEINTLKQQLAEMEKTNQALKDAEAALRLSENKFSTAFYTSPDSININRLSDGMYLEINQGFTDITGYDQEDVAGRTSLELDIWADPKDREKLIEGLRTKGEAINLEANFRMKDGDVRVGLMSAKVIQVQGEPCILSITRDISQRKETERKIQELNEHLEQRVQERTAQLEAFTYSVSHDLRAPLRAITGYSQILQDEFSDALNPEGQDYVERIHSAGKKMNDLIEGLLFLSRMSRQEMELDNLDLAEMAARIMDGLLQDQPDGKVEFHIQPCKFGWVVENVDNRLIEILLTNLMGNAIKFTRPMNPAVIELSCCEENGQRVICLRDNGVGFGKDAAEIIFNPFQRAHDENQFEGTGIGLAIVKQIIDRHGGQIWVESEPDKGAAFFFTLEKLRAGE
jgi:PAS domain S-box-containing protein